MDASVCSIASGSAVCQYFPTKSHVANLLMQTAHTLTKVISEDVGFDNYNRTHVECSPFITLYLGSKGIDSVINGLFPRIPL